MRRIVIIPIVYLLVFGLTGCSTTTWTAFDGERPGTDKDYRVTLMDGDSVILSQLSITATSVSGMQKNNVPFRVASEEVKMIEDGDKRFSPVKTVFLLAGTGLGLGLAYLSLISGGE